MSPARTLASALVLAPLLTAGVLAQRRPDFETVPADKLTQQEQRLRQSRMTWEAAARDIERDLLVKTPEEMRARLQRAREKKRDELATRRLFFTTFATHTDDVVDTLKEASPLTSTTHFLAAIDAIGDRRADMERQIAKLAKSTKPEDAAAREAMQIQVNRLKSLVQTIQDELAAHRTADEQERTRQEVNDNALRAMKSARDRLLALAEDVDQEQALWDQYYDTLDETIERNRPARPSRTPKIQ